MIALAVELTTWTATGIVVNHFENQTTQLLMQTLVSAAAICWPLAEGRPELARLTKLHYEGSHRIQGFRWHLDTSVLQGSYELGSYCMCRLNWICCLQRSCKLPGLNMNAPFVVLVVSKNATTHFVNHCKLNCIVSQHCTLGTCASVHA